MRRRDVALAIAVFGVGALAVREYISRGADTPRPRTPIPATGPITVAAAGDVLLTLPVDDAAAGDLEALLADATLRVANLEMTVHDGPSPAPVAGTWPAGTRRDAHALRRLGFDLLSLANNHAADYGEAGVRSTRRILEESGVAVAGAGQHLSEARMPAVLGEATRRVAFVAVTTSAPPAARATDPTSTLEGRAGVSPLRYRVEITVDAETFRVLRESVAGPSSGESEIVVGDARLRTGERATVDVAVDRADEDAVLASIAAARAAAEVVIVSLHSHEPSNGHEEPADFVRQFARAAIERGASLVVGHGPHGLRGVELHGDGAILYSLGNFVYRARGLADVPADTYDAGTNLFEAALSGVRPDAPGTLALDEAGWWQGVVARAVISQGRLESLTLVPVDLGVGRPLEDRGWPRPADAGLTAEILERIDGLSRAFGTRVDVRSGSAAVSLNVRQ